MGKFIRYTCASLLAASIAGMAYGVKIANERDTEIRSIKSKYPQVEEARELDAELNKQVPRRLAANPIFASETEAMNSRFSQIISDENWNRARISYDSADEIPPYGAMLFGACFGGMILSAAGGVGNELAMRQKSRQNKPRS